MFYNQMIFNKFTHPSDRCRIIISLIELPSGIAFLSWPVRVHGPIPGHQGVVHVVGGTWGVTRGSHQPLPVQRSEVGVHELRHPAPVVRGVVDEDGVHGEPRDDHERGQKEDDHQELLVEAEASDVAEDVFEVHCSPGGDGGRKAILWLEIANNLNFLWWGEGLEL